MDITKVDLALNPRPMRQQINLQYHLSPPVLAVQVQVLHGLHHLGLRFLFALHVHMGMGIWVETLFIVLRVRRVPFQVVHEVAVPVATPDRAHGVGLLTVVEDLEVTGEVNGILPALVEGHPEGVPAHLAVGEHL